MDATRRLVLEKFKEELEKKPFDDDGYRFEIVGTMFSLFGEEEEKILAGMQQLGNDMLELGMTLSSYPHRPDILCAMQRNK